MELMISLLDGYLSIIGTQSLVDGDKVRDMLLDLRSTCTALLDPPPAELIVDPAMFTEIITGI